MPEDMDVLGVRIAVEYFNEGVALLQLVPVMQHMQVAGSCADKDK